MRTQQELIDAIAARTEIQFRPASMRALENLRDLRLPKSVVDFYGHNEPSECAEGQVRLWPVADMIRENRDLVPGAIVAPLGYVVFATTFCGDTYCFDLNKVDGNGDPRIVLISHEVIGEEITAEDAARLAKPIARNLIEFLESFVREELDEDCVYE